MKFVFAQNSAGAIIYPAGAVPNHPVTQVRCFLHPYTLDLTGRQRQDILAKGWTDDPPPADYFEPITSCFTGGPLRF